MKAIRRTSLVIVLLMISFCSCELLDKELNYILVTVDLWVRVYDNEGKYVEGASVNMLIQKDGGEKVEGIGTTGSDGLTSATGVFKLYREQPIEVKAWLVGKPESYKYEKLKWETVEKDASDPDKNGLRTYPYYPTLVLTI